MKRLMGIMVVVLAVAALSAWGDVLVFDDSVHSPFSSYGGNQIVDSGAITPHGGSYSIRRDDGLGGNGVIFETSTFSYGADNILDFWVNSHAADAQINLLTVKLADDTSCQMGTRGPGVTWIVDGTPYTDQYVQLDDDPDTWEHVQFDVSQTYYAWVQDQGDMPFTIASDAVWQRFEVRGNEGTSPYLDDVSFIPEPVTLALLGIGSGLALLKRRRS